MSKRSRATRSRWVTVALTTAALTLGAPTVAHAWSNTYCGVLIYEGSWCGDGSDHSYDYNSASYGGGGLVFVCERLLNPTTKAVRSGASCGYTSITHDYGLTSSLWEAEVTHRYSGGARHTITGYAIA